MTELDIAHLVNRITGLIAALFAMGLATGYARVLDSDSALVRAIAWSICVLTGASVVECLRVVDTDNVSAHMLGVLYNCAVLFGSVYGLKAQWRMIPDEDRATWSWYSAPLYPPWGWITGLNRFVVKARAHLWNKSCNSDKRRRQRPIDFPDRRKDE